MNLLLVRHGEIPSNIKKVYAGKSPEGLTDTGICQAEEASGKLKTCGIRALYSSPVQRALQTARIIGSGIGLDIRIEKAFREIEMGPWEGMSEHDVAVQYPEEWNVWNNRPAELQLPGRETLAQLQERVLTGIQNIHHQYEDQNVVIVTHVAVIRVLLLWKNNKSLNLYKTIEVPNAAMFSMKINRRYGQGENSLKC